MVSLDDSASAARSDPSGMLAGLARFLDEFSGSFREAAKVPLRLPVKPAHVVFSGMGGSGIVGDLTRALAAPVSRVPVTVVKGYHLPRFVGRDAVLIAVSYSGETEETLACVQEALGLGAHVIGISSGGRLQKACAGPTGTHLPVPGGRQPRAAPGYLLGTALAVATHLGLGQFVLDAAAEARLRMAAQAFLPSTPEAKNPAKQFARDLHDKFPFWYASSPMGAVALRARCQLNENAKMLGRNDELPESNHNELVPWSQLNDGGRHFVGLLRQPEEAPEIRLRFDFLHSLLKRRKVAHREYVTTVPTALGRVLEGISFVDHVSMYAAILRGVDPSPIGVIDELKTALARKGKTPQLIRHAD